MIKLLVGGGKGTTLFLALDRNNTERLHDGKPILINVDELLAESRGASEIVEIVILAGETLEDAYHELRDGGLPLPERMPNEYRD